LTLAKIAGLVAITSLGVVVTVTVVAGVALFAILSIR
jgi:hypothetical protein